MFKTLAVATLALSSHAFAGDYIVKLKEGSRLVNKSIKIKSEFNLSFGKFVVIDSSEAQVKTLSQMQEVEYIEPNFTYFALDIKDSDYKNQWGLKNTGSNSGSVWFPGTEGVDINAEDAWSITTGSRSVKIAVIDTGVDYNHEDLKENIMVNEKELNGRPGVDDDGNGYIDDVYGYDFANGDADPMDSNGHGTHCAGVIGASHNSIGGRGVMAKVQVLPIQFLTASGAGTLEGALRSIDYAIERGVDIMSNSWGGGGTSQALEEAVARAEKAGILFVAAAGNSNSNNDVTPALPASIAMDNVVSVGAMDGKGKRASFSNYGQSSVHVFAPGVNIYSTIPGDRYQKMSGTSMACPFVSGIAGLLLANEPHLTYQELKSRLMNNVNPNSHLSIYSTSGGYTNAYEALRN